jgi:Flp pilus assembly protein TadG
MRLSHLARRLRRDSSGLAMTEFALIIPFFLTVGFWGIELANYSYQTMRVGQIAAHIADNASRIGDYSRLQNRRIFESDIDDLLLGAKLQAGAQMDLYGKGRVIISSLEVNAAGQQYIHWQRCLGAKVVTSSYGVQGQVRTNGMGPTGSEVYAFDKEAVMFVELQYDYQPLISSAFVGTPTLSSIASFTVRSSRDLTQVYNTNPPSPSMTCNKFTATVT